MRTITAGVAGCGLVAFVVMASGLAAQDGARDLETVVYSSLAPGSWDLYLFEEPGATPRRLTTDPGLDYNPVVSPDGRRVVFTSERTESSTNDALPHLSPDGRRIVFRSMRDGDAEIYLMNADGTDPRRLTNHRATDTMPSFSSSGDRVAFTSLRDDDYEIYLLELNEDGTPGPLERLTHSPGHDMHPRFSPDDEWLIFTSERGGLNDELPLTRVVFQPQPYGEIHAMRLSDRQVIRLTHNKWEDGPADWVK